MNRYCRTIQETLATEGPRALRDDEAAQRHLAECEDCFRALGFQNLTSFDASDHVVERLLARPEITKRAGSKHWIRSRSFVWGSLAATLLIAAIAPFMLSRTADEREVPRSIVVAKNYRPANEPQAPEVEQLRAQAYPGDADRDKKEADESRRNAPVPSDERLAGRIAGREENAELRLDELQLGDDASNVAGSRSRDYRAEVGGVSGGSKDAIPYKRRPMVVEGAVGATAPVLIESSRVAPEWPAGPRIDAQVILQATVRADGTVDDVEVLESNHPGLGFEQAAIDAVQQWRYEPARVGDRPADVRLTIVVDFETAKRGARWFLDERNVIDGLTFKSTSGYWRNTYVPGDPTMRLLQSRLAGWEHAPRLHDAARQIGQPFDTPDGAALAVYMHTDRRSLTEPGRMLVQVGLEGTPRYGGRRPAMNLALVLDLRDEISADVAIGIRSLLEAFNRAKEPGDSFRVFVAGRSGDCVVTPENFRHGFLEVTLDRLIGSPASLGSTLVDSVSSAIASIALPDDSDAPLGSNAVVLITGRGFGDATRSLADLAHQSAVAGVPLSVIGIGRDVDLSEIDLVTLAGQGNRRLLDDASAAAELVDRELAAAARAIARAVRLRIRLAPGVKLVDVIGSERLDDVRAQRVRDAERSIDLRLSRALGIESDRGADEEGIQIVIPNFYAGDSHAILLDVVASGPGPIADVSVRYKDLVHLRNGVSRASLALGHDASPNGPLERNVLKNLLSRHLSSALDDAGRALRSGDTVRATTLLDDFADLLEGLRREVPGFANDSELTRDIAMLGEYRTILGSSIAGHPDQISSIADSLRYAARLKVLPRPLETRS